MSKYLLLLPLLASACSHEGARPDLKLKNGWARETVAGQSTAAAYLTIINNGTGGDRLVSVTSDAATRTMLHATANVHGVAKMRHLGDGLEIPSKTAVELSPGQTHIMLAGLKEPLRRGSKLTLTLRFDRSGNREAHLKILDPASAGLQGAL